MHRDMINQIDYTSITDEYITLSSDSIRFWNPVNLKPTRVLIDPGFFCSMIIFDHNHVLATVTTRRRLLFFNIDTLTLLPTDINASPPSISIKKMDLIKSELKLKEIKTSDISLFNIPTIMYPAIFHLIDPTKLYFFVGDDQGFIEIFLLSAPNLRQGIDYYVQSIGKIHLHNESITKIGSISSKLCYISTSLDKTLIFWTLNENNSIQKLNILKHSLPIMNFYYNEKNQFLVTCSVSREVFLWNISTFKITNKLSGHNNHVINSINFITTSGYEYLLTLTNKKEFYLWDPLHFRLIKEWTDPSILRPENSYSSLYFDKKRNTLISGSSFPVKWLEDTLIQVDNKEISSHKYHLIGVHYSSLFNQIISIDLFSNFYVWNISNGLKTFFHQEKWGNKSSDTTCSCLDYSGKRLFTTYFNGNIQLWNFSSGTKITTINTLKNNFPISVIIPAKIEGCNYILKSGWDKIISVFSEKDFQQFNLFRSLIGHTGDITSLSYFEHGVISGSINGEVFIWSLDSSVPYSTFKLSSQSSIECFLLIKNILLIGDSKGIIYQYTCPHLQYLDSFHGHGIISSHSITSLIFNNNYIFSSDTLGYVKRWNYQIDPFNIESDILFRCSNEEIISMEIVNEGNFFLTSSRDLCIRLWCVNTLNCIGLFHDN